MRSSIPATACQQIRHVSASRPSGGRVCVVLRPSSLAPLCTPQTAGTLSAAVASLACAIGKSSAQWRKHAVTIWTSTVVKEGESSMWPLPEHNKLEHSSSSMRPLARAPPHGPKQQQQHRATVSPRPSTLRRRTGAAMPYCRSELPAYAGRWEWQLRAARGAAFVMWPVCSGCRCFGIVGTSIGFALFLELVCCV